MTTGARTVTTLLALEDNTLSLPELVGNLSPGDEIVLTVEGRPKAKLIAKETPARPPRRAGSAKGKLIILNENDDHLADFGEYMA